jgi:hypothetical protein
MNYLQDALGYKSKEQVNKETETKKIDDLEAQPLTLTPTPTPTPTQPPAGEAQPPPPTSRLSYFGYGGKRALRRKTHERYISRKRKTHRRRTNRRRSKLHRPRK